MKQTGQKLKTKREALNLTISEVSLATKINPKVLNAMENGDLAHLPAKTFLRGFVRAYAAHLKMNVDETLALFSQELGEVQKEAQESAAAAAAAQEAASPSTPVDVTGEGSTTFRMFVVGGIIVLIVLIIGIRSLVQKYERERAVEALSEISSGKVVPLENKDDDKDKNLTPGPEASTAAPAATPDSPKSETVAIPETPKVADVKAPEPKIDIKAVPVPPPAPVAVPTPPPAPKPAEPAKPVETPKPAPPTAAKPPVIATPPVAATSAKTRHEIILEALDKVEVKFELNGQKKTVSLGPNQVHTIVAEGPLTLDVSDGGAVNITDNGRDKGTPGDLGRPKQVKIP